MSKGTVKRNAPPDKDQKESKIVFGRPAHEQLVKGLSHRVRAECLTLLSERVASPRELAETLDEDLSNVSYHVRVLSELGLIELVKEEPVRGAVAHFYKAVERPLFSAAEAEQMPPEVQKAFSAFSLDRLIEDATEAIKRGTFNSRPDWNLTRTTLLLDSKGFARLSKAMDELLELVLEEQAASAERRNKSGEEPIRATAATALFVMPDPKGTEESADA
ncbi:MAG TPA: winged helix-turn-helix domain-containing protein [Solirubrobacterales bacterium]|nr:winged helix-turn-helix domain-containing protein [Solirubrobacterales bacterium]